ncbi:GNAT family N-acetyltransferase [Altererythrobacter aurantiacus]|uniref:GNAT family N-acetyltransferase n=2 Tax=Parapontixanthobacter aurantiacus TaxID=1463599 RepID=A0A844ZAU6_9SPHN|nr:GNAT family N-acetyltransferase [Parapontixanthobacter aurantiacus]
MASDPILPAAPVEDIDRMMEIMEAAFDPRWGEAWNRRQLSDALVTPSTHYLLCDVSGNCPGDRAAEQAGFLLSRAAPGEEELLLVAVRPEYRRRGHAAKLIERFFRDAAARGAEAVFLEMRENNPARKLYERSGFEPIGRRRGYYRESNGERLDALTFKRSLLTFL